MLLKFAAPLLLFSSSALDTANNASYENINEQDRCVFPIAQLNFPFEIISKHHSIFFFLNGLLLLIFLSFFQLRRVKKSSTGMCKSINH